MFEVQSVEVQSVRRKVWGAKYGKQSIDREVWGVNFRAQSVGAQSG